MPPRRVRIRPSFWLGIEQLEVGPAARDHASPIVRPGRASSDASARWWCALRGEDALQLHLMATAGAGWPQNRRGLGWHLQRWKQIRLALLEDQLGAKARPLLAVANPKQAVIAHRNYAFRQDVLEKALDEDLRR